MVIITCSMLLNIDYGLMQCAECMCVSIKCVNYVFVIKCTCNVHVFAADLSALGGMSALLELDASYNAVDKLLAFTPPNCLKIVKMSHNKITEMADMSAHHYLHYLDLDGKDTHKYFYI